MSFHQSIFNGFAPRLRQRVERRLSRRRIRSHHVGGNRNLVRLQKRLARKRYLNSKRVYEYERVSLHIPRKYHELIKPFLNQDFDVSVAAEKDIIVITLTPQKPVPHAESPSYKTALEARPET